MYTDLYETVSKDVRETARRTEGVARAYVRTDGQDFRYLTASDIASPSFNMPPNWVCVFAATK